MTAGGRRVERVDVAHEAALRRWLAVADSADQDHRSIMVRTAFGDFLGDLRDQARPGTPFWMRDHAGDVLGTLLCHRPEYDNRHLLDVSIRVPSAHRRQGIGTALLNEAISYAQARERAVLMGEVVEPMATPPGASPGSRFAAHAGFGVGMIEHHHVLDLPVPPDLLKRLAGRAASKADGYRLVEFDSVCPDEFVASYCAAQTRFLSEAPIGDLELEPQVWTPDRLREAEDRRLRQGRDGLTVLALTSGGAVAGYTQLLVPSSDDGRVSQADTLVLPKHRGHRLGLAMKVRNLQRLQQRHRDRRWVGTWNADTNTAMLVVNAALGARPRERMIEHQRRCS